MHLALSSISKTSPSAYRRPSRLPADKSKGVHQMTKTVFQERLAPRGGMLLWGWRTRGEVVSAINYHSTLFGGSDSISEPREF